MSWIDAELVEQMIRGSGGVELRRGTAQTWAHRRSPTTDIDGLPGFPVRGTDLEALVATGKIPIQPGELYELDGVTLRLRGSREGDDPAETVLELARP